MNDLDDLGLDEHIVERPFSSLKRILITLAVLVAMGFGIYSAWWFWLASEARDHVEGWVRGMRADGREAGYERLSVGGFPGRLMIRIDGIEAADPAGGWRVRLPALNATLPPWTIDRLDGAFTVPVELDMTEGAAPGQYTVRAESNSFRVDRDSGGRLRVDLGGLNVTRADVPDALTAKTVMMTLMRGANPVYGRVFVDAREVALPPEMHSAFGSDMPYFRVTAEATGAELPQGINAQSLRQWTADGGAIDIRSLDIRHGVLGMAGEGTMALDGDLQPIGAFTADVSGFNQAIDALVRAGVAREQDGNLAKVVLGVLSKQPPGGGPRIVSLPLSLQDRTLSAGPVPLIRLRPIAWE